MTPGVNTDSPAQLAAVALLQRAMFAADALAAESGALDREDTHTTSTAGEAPPAAALAAACCLGELEKNCNGAKTPPLCETEPELEALESHAPTSTWREARSAAFARRSERPGDWYDQRAQGELRSLPARGRACGRVVTVTLTCTGCGLFHERHYRCGIRQACDACCSRYYRRTRARLIRAAGRAAGREHAAWKARGSPKLCSTLVTQDGVPVRVNVDGSGAPMLRMLTLTVRHSGDPALDRDRIALGWIRLRAWLQKRFGYAPTFCLAWEMTSGRDGGDGHVHAHVVTWWPWLDWSALAKEWSAATDGHGCNIDTGARSARALEARRHSRPAEQAAYYASKYASKDELRELFADVDKLAAWYRATRGRRLHSTSRGFWLDEPARTPCCRAPFHLESARGTSYAVTAADDRGPRPCNARDGPHTDPSP